MDKTRPNLIETLTYILINCPVPLLKGHWQGINFKWFQALNTYFFVIQQVFDLAIELFVAGAAHQYFSAAVDNKGDQKVFCPSACQSAFIRCLATSFLTLSVSVGSMSLAFITRAEKVSKPATKTW